MVASNFVYYSTLLALQIAFTNNFFLLAVFIYSYRPGEDVDPRGGGDTIPVPQPQGR